ncbi:hypothetical protein GCM10010464_49790 [Pseudonocardia yunnanensis]
MWVIRLIGAGHAPEHAEDCAGHTASAECSVWPGPTGIAPAEVPAPDPAPACLRIFVRQAYSRTPPLAAAAKVKEFIYVTFDAAATDRT